MLSTKTVLQCRGIVLCNHLKYNKSKILSRSSEKYAFIHTSNSNEMARRWQKQIAFQSELTNPVEVVFGSEKKAPDDVGTPADKKPFKVSVKKYHLYKWCGCGKSHNQPFCDGTHSNFYMKNRVKGGPVTYIAPEDRDIWFCNCKQTKHRPFCDGTHRNPEIQAMRFDGKPDLWDPTTLSTTELKSSEEEIEELSDLNEIDETSTSEK